MDVILAWAAAECRSCARAGIRIDTWASNTELIAFYQRRGFLLVGHRHIAVDPRLPPHYHHNEFALLESAVGEDAGGLLGQQPRQTIEEGS